MTGPMTELVMLVPSRGRPKAAAELVKAFAETTTGITFLAFVVDEDDPARLEYAEVCDGEHSGVLVTPSHTMVQALNLAAKAYADWGPYAIGFCGDDHRPRTAGFDRAYVDALRQLGTGIVYGDDLLQGANLPTQCAMTADIVRALGYMAPPELTHLCVDDFWRDLGRDAGCIRYLPDVVVEHMHPIAGKADWDDGHERVNHPSMYQRDLAAYALYRGARFADDVAKVKALREAPTGGWTAYADAVSEPGGDA